MSWATLETSGFWSAAAIDYAVTVNTVSVSLIGVSAGWVPHVTKTDMPCDGIRRDKLEIIGKKITALRITITKTCHVDGIVSLKSVNLVAIPASSSVYVESVFASSVSFSLTHTKLAQPVHTDALLSNNACTHTLSARSLPPSRALSL